MTGKLTHIGEDGEARMVDVSDKEITDRTATARGRVLMQPETLKLIMDGSVKKGDVISVARLAGINVNLYTIGVYVVSGLLAGLAGVVLAMRLDSVQPTAGVSYELDTIAAVVIGGTSLSGGKGGILGTIIGVLIIGVLRNGLNLLGVSPFTQAVVIGVVIALAVAAEAIKRK